MMAQADRLLALIKGLHIELFHDQYREPHARFKVVNHNEISKIRSNAFRRWISKHFWESEGKVLRSDSINSALNVIEAKACFEGKLYELHTRTAWHDNAIFYDLGNWKAVKINECGWEIVNEPPILFRRHSHQKERVIPENCGVEVIYRLFDFVNLPKPTNEDERLSESQLLFLGNLVAALIPDIPHPIDAFHGVQGAAKTSALQVKKALVDPSELKTLTHPSTIPDLVHMVSHHWFVPFDNLTYLPDGLSDALCRVVTGEGFSKRALYTDDEDFIYTFRRCLGLSGINLVTTKPDLLDRTLIFELEQIDKDHRKEEKKFWQEFEEVKPKILGALFNLLSKAIENYPSVKLKGKPRMADFAMWGCAVARSLGKTDDEFMKAYTSNISAQNEEAIDASPVAKTVIAFMKDKRQWEGSASELLEKLNMVAEELKLAKDKGYPKDARWLWRRINEVKTNLLAVGIKASKQGDTKNRRIFLTHVFEGGDDGTHGRQQRDENDDTHDTEDISQENQGLTSINTRCDDKQHYHDGTYDDTRNSLKTQEKHQHTDSINISEDLFDDTKEAVTSEVSYDNYHLILSEEELDKVIERIKATKEVSIDLETTSKNPMKAQIVGIALSPAPHEAYYIPVGHKLTAPESINQLSSEYVLQKLRPIIEDEAIGKIGQNLRYEFIILERYGLKLSGIAHDTMVAAHFLDSSRLSYSLDELAMYYLGHKTITYKDVTGTGRNQINFERVELEKAKTYACEDADVAMILSKILSTQLEELNLISVFKDELKFIEVLARMEINGVKVDSNLLENMSVEFEKELERIKEALYSEVGSAFNLNSPIQLGEVLFDKLKLPQKKLTKGGKASTKDEVLEELAKLHPLAAMVREHRKLAKLKSTYADALPKLINPNTGRIHTSLKQTGTSTGRLSSSEPNLQNIPVKIREPFIPESGFVLLSADYSQIELRVLAHFSEDDSLVNAFLAGSDVHRRTAAEIFGVSEDQVSPEMRRLAKTINFGIIYGITPSRLAKQIGTSSTDAKSYIDKYFRRYGKVKSYQEKSIREAERRGYAVTILGRRRPIPQLKSLDRATRGRGEREAINTPIQGSAADIIKIAMIRIHDQLNGFKSRMILQVHDELLFEIHESEIDKISRIIKTEMEGAWKLKVPLKVNIGMGKSWAEAH